jgi:hypothetical protein
MYQDEIRAAEAAKEKITEAIWALSYATRELEDKEELEVDIVRPLHELIDFHIEPLLMQLQRMEREHEGIEYD